MNTFTLQEFSDLVVSKLEEIDKEVVLQNPTADSIFPCTVVETPLETILVREGTDIVRKRFSISIEEWTDKQRTCMKELAKTEEKLKEINLLKTSNNISLYDEITRKYRIINTYEVIYNGLNNSFDLIK